MNTSLPCVLLVVFIVIFVSSAGCVKTTQNLLEGNAQPPTPSETAVMGSPAPEMENPAGTAAVITPIITGSTPVQTFAVDEIDPGPYITPDPYKLPYRNLTNSTSGDPFRKERIPQFTKHIVLGSNTTAFRINAPQGPLVLDFTFSPSFNNPDQTGDTGSSYPGTDEESSDDSSGDSSRTLSGAYSFVYPYAEVTVIDAITNGTVVKDGFGKIYSSEKEKKITVYRDSTYIVTLTGDFMDVDMKIYTGSGEVVTTTPYPASGVASASVSDEW